MLTARPLPPGGPALAILDAVLDIARRELAWRHPLVDDLLEPGTRDDALDLTARLLVGRLDELRDLADAYRRALLTVGARDIF